MAPRMALCVRELMRVCHWWTAILWLLWIAYSIVAIDALYKRKTKFFRIRFIALSLSPLSVCKHNFTHLKLLTSLSMWALFPSPSLICSHSNRIFHFHSFHFYLLIFEFPSRTACPCLFSILIEFIIWHNAHWQFHSLRLQSKYMSMCNTFATTLCVMCMIWKWKQNLYEHFGSERNRNYVNHMVVQ